MTDLSPAAQAVLDAFLKTLGEEPMPGWDYGRDIAAALEAVADQVVPGDYTEAYDCCLVIMQEIRSQLLAIAAELRAQ